MPKVKFLKGVLGRPKGRIEETTERLSRVWYANGWIEYVSGKPKQVAGPPADKAIKSPAVTKKAGKKK
jgi:hypothetical protein